MRNPRCRQKTALSWPKPSRNTQDTYPQASKSKHLPAMVVHLCLMLNRSIQSVTCLPLYNKSQTKTLLISTSTSILKVFSRSSAIFIVVFIHFIFYIPTQGHALTNFKERKEGRKRQTSVWEWNIDRLPPTRALTRDLHVPQPGTQPAVTWV